ncbi:MAG TPA: TonB-dependent receptor [Gemmatimonadales bacterium]|nr:TonB-dependent receptor [Gemmatimonadales bacterium]
MSRSTLLAAVLALIPAHSAFARQDSVAADSVRRVRGVDVVAERLGSGITNSLLLGDAVTSVGESRVGEQPVRILPDALRELPGVQVQQTNAGHGTVILRGLVGNQVLVLVDGVRLNNSTVRDGPNQLLSLVDPELIQRVDVVRGPGSVVFGSDAMGGVVNAVTRAFAGRMEGAAAIGFSGSDAGVRARLEVGGALRGGRLAVQLGLASQSAGELRAGSGLVQPGTSWRGHSGSARLRWRAGACDELALTLLASSLRDVGRYDRLVRYRPPAPGPDAEFVFSPQQLGMAVARWSGTACNARTYHRSVAAGWLSQLEGRMQRANLMGGGGPAPDSVRVYQRDDVRTVFVAGWVEPRLAAGTSLRLGGDVYRDRVDARGFIESVATGDRTPTVRVAGADSIASGRFPDGATATSGGAYLHAARLLGRRWRLAAGVRADLSAVKVRAGDDFGGDVNATNATLSAHGGASLYHGAWVFTAHLGRSFRAPNIYDFATVSAVPGGVQLPSPALRPEHGVAAELTARLDRGPIVLITTLFHSWLRDVLDRVPGSYRGDTLFQGRRVFLTTNLATARLYGAELAATIRAGGLAWRAQAFWTRGTQRTGAVSEAMTRIPPLSGLLGLRQPVSTAAGPGWAEVVARGALPQRRLSPRDRRDSRIAPDGTDGWFTVGLRAGFDFGSLRLGAGLENLTDRLYREHGSGIDAPGRHLWVRVEHRIGG